VIRIPQTALAMVVADAPDLLARHAVNHAAVMRLEGEALAEWVMSAPSLTDATDRLGRVIDDLTDTTEEEEDQ
jgi:hypothetical protein